MFAYFVGDRVKAALFGLLLAVFGEDVFYEFGAQRIECLGRLLVDVHIEVTGDRVLAGKGRLGGGVIAGPTVVGSQRDRANAIGLVADAGIANREFITGDALYDGLRTGQKFDAGLVVSTIKSRFPEIFVSPRKSIAALERDRPSRPIAGQAKVAPRSDVDAAGSLTI